MAEPASPTPQGDLMWILAVFLVVGLLWFYSGGPKAKPLSNQSYPETYTHSNDQEIFGKNETTNGDNVVNIGKTIKEIERDLARLEEEVKRAQEAKESSSLKGIALIDTATAARSDPNEEYVRIRISSSAKNRVMVSGWELYSPMTGKSRTIGYVATKPKIGEPDIMVPIYAYPGDTIIVSTGRSPIGISFRTNICSGYLSQFQTFTPRLPGNCPLPRDEASFLQTNFALSENCLNFLRSVGRCQTYTKSFPSDVENNCQIFVQSNLNYNACVDNHIGDPSFPGKEWRVYIGETSELWRNKNEVIKLLDIESKTIDVDSYR